MAEVLPQTLGRQLTGFTALPLPRQLGLLGGLAVVVAVAVTMVMWGTRPSYQVLFPGMSERDKAQAMTALTRAGVPHRLDPSTGMLSVPSSKLHHARLQLATDGLPRSEGVGFELLDQETGIGTSRMMENSRYQRALEGELARSVMTLNSVDSARVHLALPRQTVFVRDRVRPSASVLVNLHPGRSLDQVQISGIVHLVASSVAELEPERVTVVDQRGRLLSQPDEGSGAGIPARQLEYTRQLEEAIRRRVQDILAPMVGESGMRVQVTAEMDFTQIESTREWFDGDNLALRSEQVVHEESSAGAVGGVPGALSNQPPGGAVVVAPGALDATGSPDERASPVSRNNRSIRNYEVDRTVQHTRQAPASISRLSVAVVVDDRETLGAGGERVRQPRDQVELDHLTGLVRDAVGFNEARGDRVTLVNAAFREVEPLPPAEAVAFWTEAWFLDLVKQGLGALGVLLLFLLVLRPALRRLAQNPVPMTRLAAPGANVAAIPAGAAALGPGAAELKDDHIALSGRTGPSAEDRLLEARNLAKEDPRLVAQVVRQWMDKDE